MSWVVNLWLSDPLSFKYVHICSNDTLCFCTSSLFKKYFKYQYLAPFEHLSSILKINKYVIKYPSKQKVFINYILIPLIKSMIHLWMMYIYLIVKNLNELKHVIYITSQSQINYAICNNYFKETCIIALTWLTLIWFSYH